MTTIDLDQADEALVALIRRATNGETIVFEKGGRRQAKLIGIAQTGVDAPEARRKLGMLQGQMRAAADFDAPLPDDLLDRFDGRK